MSAIASLVGLINPYLQKFLFDDVLLGQQYSLLFLLAAVFFSVFVFTRVFGAYHNYVSSKLTQNMVLGVKKELFEHLERLHIGFHQSQKVGDMMSRMESDVASIQVFISTLLSSALLNLFTGFSILIVSFALSWQATSFALLFFPVYLFTQHLFVKTSTKYYKQVRERSADIFSFLQERLSSMKAIKEFARERLESRTFAEKNQALIKLRLKAQVFGTMSGLVTGLIVYIPSFVILFYGGYQVMIGVISIGTLLALRAYIQQLFGPIVGLGSLHKTLKTTMVSVDRVYDFLDVQPLIQDKPNARPLRTVKGDIAFNNVSFRYDKGKVLDGVSFHIQPGQTVGLVGPSGSGKTTIANLLMRFYDVESGSIKLDGIDLRDIKIQSLREHVGIVSQETILFNMSIKENIRFGNADANDEDVVRAAKLANIHDFIEGLPNGYDTMAGERGVKFSGGQRQRISIARVVLKNPPIILLDEATSSLDSASEKKVQEALQRVTKDKTTLIIAHRLSTLEQVDKIVTLHNKKVAEEGAFSELLEKNGEFARLYNLQFGGYHQFEQRLDQEITRAGLYKRPLSLVVLDFLDLGRIHELHGKTRAGKFMESITAQLALNIRKIDFFIPVPHGKNVILLVLPEVDKQRAERIVERLVARMKKGALPELQVHYRLITKKDKFSSIKRVVAEFT